MGSFGLCGYIVEMIAMCRFSFSVFYFFDCSYAAKIILKFDRYRQNYFNRRRIQLLNAIFEKESVR